MLASDAPALFFATFFGMIQFPFSPRQLKSEETPRGLATPAIASLAITLANTANYAILRGRNVGAIKKFRLSFSSPLAVFHYLQIVEDQVMS